MTQEQTILSLASSVIRLQADTAKLATSLSVLKVCFAIRVVGLDQDELKRFLGLLQQIEQQSYPDDSEQQLNLRIIDAMKHWVPKPPFQS